MYLTINSEAWFLEPLLSLGSVAVLINLSTTFGQALNILFLPSTKLSLINEIQNFFTSDEDKLREHGYFKAAEVIRQEKIKFEQNKINKQIEESRQRQQLQEQKRAAWQQMSLGERMAAEPLTQDQILRNRQRYGVGQ